MPPKTAAPAVPDFKQAATPKEETPATTTGAPDQPISKETLARFDAGYRGIWEADPPPGYVEQAASQMNLHEFLAYERAKPAFRFSPMYQEIQGEANA